MSALGQNNFSAPGMERFAGLFPDGDYRMQLRMRRLPIHEYFQPTPLADTVLSERRRWLDQDPGSHLACMPEGEEAVREAARLLADTGVVRLPEELIGNGSAGLLLMELGRNVEADLIVVRPGLADEFRLVGGSVCFPSSWSLEEKIGRSLTAIHAPVPGLNEQLGVSIGRFLQRLVPGTAWCRENWGLSASGELNHHPSRGLPRLDSEANREGVWLRVERQALVSLPKSGAVLFAIRIELFPLIEVMSDRSSRDGLLRALRTMSPELAEYKGLASARERLIELLGSTSTED